MNAVIEYFEISAVKYSKGDVIKLLQSKFDCAGPLLQVIVNGIDNLGGICYGFKKGNSKARSVEFMKNKMGIPQSVAEFLYTAIRCGVAHQGMPKIGVKFYVQYSRLAKGKMFYTYQNDGYLWLDVVEFAYTYVDAVDNIAKEPEKYIIDLPSINSDEMELFKKAISEVKDDLEDLCIKIGNQRAKEGDFINSSMSAYTPSNILNF